eukprot:TRINITY_DN8206_c0_g1_i3.p1 TRINITY_DN8206_c0_g1~~TRINITY_DN8206_c0_g1_i3.p1  ORF type:complete len:282 (-),score=22.51 TRINITY_DN8206_c0_g1_i3:169-1014(-)
MPDLGGGGGTGGRNDSSLRRKRGYDLLMQWHCLLCKKFVAGQPGSGQTTTFEELLASTFKQKAVIGQVACSTASFDGDPAQGYFKWCYCQQAPCSATFCSDLGWADDTTWPEVAGKQGLIGVCGMPGSSCEGEKSHVEAEVFCKNKGARLCTANELMKCEAAGTGCGYDHEQVWTSTPCTGGFMTVKVGEMCSAPQSTCTTSDSAYSGRCCADADASSCKASCDKWETTGWHKGSYEKTLAPTASPDGVEWTWNTVPCNVLWKTAASFGLFSFLATKCVFY